DPLAIALGAQRFLDREVGGSVCWCRSAPHLRSRVAGRVRCLVDRDRQRRLTVRCTQRRKCEGGGEASPAGTMEERQSTGHREGILFLASSDENPWWATKSRRAAGARSTVCGGQRGAARAQLAHARQPLCIWRGRCGRWWRFKS